jgi:hypothetical protein
MLNQDKVKYNFTFQKNWTIYKAKPGKFLQEMQVRGFGWGDKKGRQLNLLFNTINNSPHVFLFLFQFLLP